MPDETWREALGRLTMSASEKKRVTGALGIRAITLQRWIHDKAAPRIDSLEALPLLFPSHRKNLERLILQEFPEAHFPEVPPDDHIPTAFLDEVLKMHCYGNKILAANTILSLSLNQLHAQINTHQCLDYHIHVYRCSPPHPNVQSIYEVSHLIGDLAETPPLSFCGIETLAGQAVQHGDMLQSEQGVAIPLKRHNEVGGCLFVRALQPPFAGNVDLIKRYALRIPLAFPDSAFFPQSNIEVSTFPGWLRQKTILEEFYYSWLNDPLSQEDVSPDQLIDAETLVLRVLQQKEAAYDDGQRPAERLLRERRERGRERPAH